MLPPKESWPKNLLYEFEMCCACEEHRCHTEEEWAAHPYRGHGYMIEIGWTHPDLRNSCMSRKIQGGVGGKRDGN
jgi:hypothetical protein